MAKTTKDTPELQAEVATQSNPSFIYKDTPVAVKPKLTIAETYELIERVVAETFVNDIAPSKLHTDIAFAITVIDMYTDYELPTKMVGDTTVFDSQASYDAAKEMMQGVCNLADGAAILKLREYIDDRIQFEKDIRIAAASRSVATEEAIETVSELAHRTLELVNKAADQVDRNGDKLFKALTPKKIERLVDGLIAKIGITNATVAAKSE